MTTPSAYEIVNAWEDLEQSIRDYRRHDWRYEDSVERNFATFARLIQRVPKEAEDGNA